MSIHYLMNAVRERLRLHLLYAATDVDVGAPPGQPPPRCGKVFACIHQGPYTDSGGLMSINEAYGLTVTLTVRINEPFDRLGRDNLQKLTQGVNDRAAAIRLAVHNSYEVLAIANTALWAATALPVGGFIEPLWCESVDTPSVVGSDWFHSEKGGEVGFACDVRFGRARRVQSLESAS